MKFSFLLLSISISCGSHIQTENDQRIKEINDLILYCQEEIKNKNLNNIELFVQFEQDQNAVRVTDLSELNNKTYHLFINIIYKEKHIVSFVEIPFSSSGDSKKIFSYYFDQNGKTIGFKQKTTFFNDSCDDGVWVEEKLCYYDKTSKLITETYKVFDINGDVITDKNRCVVNYETQYKVYKNLIEIPNFKKLR